MPQKKRLNAIKPNPIKPNCIMKNQTIIAAAVLAVGIALAGMFVYLGFGSFAARDRVVSVRGLAEREVKADKVIWPIVYKASGSDLANINASVNDARTRIVKFLTDNGLKDNEISVGSPQVTDRLADRYSEMRTGQERFLVTYVITVSSAKVDLVRGLIARTGELLSEGVALSSDDYGNSVQYQFNGLNSIKPQMIEQATKSAREAAVKFAKDSDSQLGKIKNASQGLFTIEDRDQYTPYIKKVRVVTSVDYYLES